MRRAGAAAAGLGLAEALGATVARAEGRSDRVDDFIESVQRAKIFDLSHTWDENSPIAGVNPPYAMELAATHATPAEDPGHGSRGTFGDGGKLSFTSEIQHWSGSTARPASMRLAISGAMASCSAAWMPRRRPAITAALGAAAWARTSTSIITRSKSW